MTFAAAAIDLARKIVRDHERSSPGTVSVIPVVVDNLDEAMPVLEAVRKLAGATWLDADDFDGPVPLTRDSRRLGQLLHGLEVAGPSGTTKRLSLRPSAAGVADPFFTPPSGPVPSPGDSTALGLYRAIAHQDLDQAELGIIVYREAVLDVHTKRALWRAAVEWFVDLPHSRLRSLVVVVEGPIDIATHCQTGVGFRYALQDARLLKRRGRDDLQAHAQLMARQSSPFVLFLGAGFSASSKLPLGNTLRDQTIRRLLGIKDRESLSSHQLALRFHAWISDRPELMSRSERKLPQLEYAETLTLEQVVRAEVGFTGTQSQTLIDFKAHHDDIVNKPGAAVLDLAKILEATPKRIVLAGVNFDQLVEANTSAPIRVFASESDFADADNYITRYLAGKEDAIPYLKLHGSIDRLDTCVMNTEQTELGIGDAKLRALQALLSTPARLWIYIGASMRDRDLVPVLADESFRRSLDERWVAPYLADTVEDFAEHRQGAWVGSKFPRIEDRLVTETADAFFDALAAAWPSTIPPAAR